MWAVPLIATLLLVFSIHFSHVLATIFSCPPVVFLGSISYAMYLLHTMTIRTILAWIIYGIIPESGRLAMRPESGVPFQRSILWTLVTVVVLCLWAALLLYICTLWRDNVDKWFGNFAEMAEEIVTGKRTVVVPSISAIQRNAQQYIDLKFDVADEDRELRTTNKNHDMESA